MSKAIKPWSHVVDLFDAPPTGIDRSLTVFGLLSHGPARFPAIFTAIAADAVASANLRAFVKLKHPTGAHVDALAVKAGIDLEAA